MCVHATPQTAANQYDPELSPINRTHTLLLMYDALRGVSYIRLVCVCVYVRGHFSECLFCTGVYHSNLHCNNGPLLTLMADGKNVLYMIVSAYGAELLVSQG